jgi:hypothetical protein
MLRAYKQRTYSKKRPPVTGALLPPKALISAPVVAENHKKSQPAGLPRRRKKSRARPAVVAVESTAQLGRVPSLLIFKSPQCRKPGSGNAQQQAPFYSPFGCNHDGYNNQMGRDNSHIQPS